MGREARNRRCLKSKVRKLGDEGDRPGRLRAEVGRGPGVEGVYEGGAR